MSIRPTFLLPQSYYNQLRMAESSADIQIQDFSHLEADDQLDQAGLELMRRISSFPAIPLSDGSEYFDNPVQFAPKPSMPRSRYLYVSTGCVVDPSGFAKLPNTMQVDSFFFVPFFADIYEPIRWPSRAERYKQPTEVLAVCGFDCRSSQSGKKFYEISQFQGALWGERESIKHKDFIPYYKDIGFLRWPSLATHIVEQLAWYDHQQHKDVIGVFILPHHVLERRERKNEPSKAMQVANEREYELFQLPSRDPLPAQRYWLPIEKIPPDTKFQKLLQI